MRGPASVTALVGFMVLVALAAACRPGSFQTPLSEDTGAYLYVGQALLDGQTPYVDAADNKGPLTYLLFALVRLLAGTSTSGVRLTLLPFVAMAALALGAYVQHHAGRAAGALAGAALAVLASAIPLQGEDPNTEQYGLAPMVGALWLATRPGRASAAGAGALVGAATLMNLGFAGVTPLVALELARHAGGRARLGRLAAAALGGLAITGLAVGWLAALGALDDARVQVIGRATQAVGSGGEAGLLDVPARGLWLLGLAGSAVAMLDRRLRGAALVMGLWIAVMGLRVKLSSYEFTHHYHPVLPGIAGAMALGVAAVWSRGPRLGLAAGLLTLGFAATHYVIQPAVRSLDVAPERRAMFPSYALAYPVGKFLRSATEKDDTVFVAGNNPTVYWVASRRAPTRFFAEYPLVEPSYREERRRQLFSRPPRALVIFPGGSIFGGEARELVARLPYRPVYEREGARVWLLEER